MGISKKQKHIKKICACGCDQKFKAFPVYSNSHTKNNPQNYDTTSGDKKATLYISKYKRGHTPENQKNQFGKKPAWNKGLTKNDHPSISKMGFQPGHLPYTDWSHVHKKQRHDHEYRKKWLAAKKGQIPWNKGLIGSQYPNGIKNGAEHGNWGGNPRGVVDLSRMKKLKLEIMKRDNYTCQKCGGHNYKDRGSRIRLEVHHIISLAEDISIAFDSNNLTTLCHSCHLATDNFGTKVVHKLKNQGGK